MRGQVEAIPMDAIAGVRVQAASKKTATNGRRSRNKTTLQAGSRTLGLILALVLSISLGFVASVSTVALGLAGTAGGVWRGLALAAALAVAM